METVTCHIPIHASGPQPELERAKGLGFSSVQIYTFWRELEPAEGRCDFSIYDPQVTAIQKAGLKWVPFFIMGPRYAAPDWWLKHPDHVPLRCLEHNRNCPIESIWNPLFRLRITRMLEAFASHYRPWDVIESIMPGICGDYGEAIMPVLGNWPGAYHTHRGLWCGGADAVASFQKWLRERHGTVDGLNRAWRSNVTGWDGIKPFPQHQSPSPTAWFELIEWYRHSMTGFARFWMEELKRIFPTERRYLITGGEEEVEHASLFADQAKVAAATGAGLRLTNEGNKFYDNQDATAYTWSACQAYGAPLGLEPVGPITPRGLRERIFGSLAYGNRQIFHYWQNVCRAPDEEAEVERSLKQYQQLAAERPTGSCVGVYWPTDQAVFQGRIPMEAVRALRAIRQDYPVRPISDQMILDGHLDSVNAFAMVGATMARRPVLEKIAAWANQPGRILMTCGRVFDIELNAVAAFDAAFGILPESEETHGISPFYARALEGYPSLATMKEFQAIKSWWGLAPTVRPLFECRAETQFSVCHRPVCTALFENRLTGGGRALFYSGFINFEKDPEAIHVTPPVPRLLLDDLCRLSKIESFGLQAGEVARCRLDGRTLVLTDQEIRAVE